jgi:hypothetical protein
MGTLRIDAHLRSLSQGPKRPGPGRPKTSDGKVTWDGLSRFETVETDAEDIVLSHQVLNHVQCQGTLRVVRVVDTQHHRSAVRFRIEVDLDALALYRSSKARCHIEFLCRDATQFPGLTDCQARSQATRNLHFNARLRAITRATLAARQHNREATATFSPARLQRRAFHQHLSERMSQH